MKTTVTSFALAAIASCAIAAEMPISDPFEPLADIPAGELLPTNATFAIAKDGSLLLGGKPRYFPAVLWYGDTMWGCDRKEDDFGPLQWLYNRMPNYEAAQRLGIDAGGFYAPLNWMNRIYRPWNKRRDPAFEGQKYGITIGNGLSMYVDMTASEWAHGSIWHADVPIDPDSKVKPETCKKEGHEGELCNHKECGAELGAPGRLSNEAWTQGHQHWMPWSIVHPQGRSLYKHMWEGASIDARDAAQSVGNRPWCYELLNEPACWDESAYAKKLFAETMKKKYGKIETLNHAWAASESGDRRFNSFEELAEAYGKPDNRTAYLVEYTKFMEDCFASLLAEGADIIRDKVDDKALATFQPCTIRTRGIDLYTAYDKLGVVCSHTGGRGIMEAHMLRGLADGKPIVDSEMYIGASESSIRNSFLDQFQRGYNISYAFKWNRMQKSSYNFLNLDNVKPEALLGIREAKLDALDVAEFFAPRDRGYPRDVAVLFSSTTERLAQCAGHQSYKMFDQAIVGLDYAHLCPDVIWENDVAVHGAAVPAFNDRLAAASSRLGRYKVLVAAGVDALRPGVCENIGRWVEEGGRLVLVGEAMGLCEYGGGPTLNALQGQFPGITVGKRKDSETVKVSIGGVALQASCWRDTVLDDSWELLGSIGDQPAFWRKSFGKGAVFFANAKLPGDSIGAFTALAAAEVGVKPCCETTDALDPAGAPLYGIEVTPALHGDCEAWIVTPRTMGARVVRFRPAAPAPNGAVMLRIWNRPRLEQAGASPAGEVAGGCPRMVAYRQILEPDADGSYVLPTGDRSILVRGPEAELRRRYSGERAKWLEPLSAAKALTDGKAYVEEQKAKRKASKPAFDVDPDKVHPLDLRPFANRRFVDKVAGDGRDGWTDQGVQQSLTDTPWGITVCNGVPMDFIRYDQNGYRDCIVMKSQRLKEAPADEMPYPERIEGIKVDRKVGNIYFLHAIAWGILNKVEAAFTYVVHYGDGTVEELPVRNYREVWDWGFLALTGDMATNHCVKGWANGSNKGLYLWRWTNPHPEKAITTIDIVSACGAQIPLIAAISVEDPGPEYVTVDGGALKKNISGNGVRASVTNGIWKVALDDNATSWVTATCEFTNRVPYQRGIYKKLVFEMNRLPDQWGNYHDHATPQFMLKGFKNGSFKLGNWRVAQHKDGSPFYRTDNDPETWETASLPFSWGIVGDDWTQIGFFAIQFQQMPAEHSGLEFRDFRFEVSDEPPPPLPPPPPPPPAAPDLDPELGAVADDGDMLE